MVLVDLPAVRPGRNAAKLSEAATVEPVRELLAFLRDAVAEPIPGGIRLLVEHEVATIAALADQLRSLANEWPFLSFRLEADPPRCNLEVTGVAEAAGFARTVFGALRR